MVALRLAAERSEDYECGGVLFEYQGSFYYTDPVTSENEHRLAYEWILPPGGVPRGTYHTHPELAGFSRQDKADARQKDVEFLQDVKFRDDPGSPDVSSTSRGQSPSFRRTISGLSGCARRLSAACSLLYDWANSWEDAIKFIPEHIATRGGSAPTDETLIVYKSQADVSTRVIAF